MVKAGPPGADPGTDRYTRDPDDLVWLEQFTVEPVDPDGIAGRLDDGEVLATGDIPTYLDQPLTVEVDTGIVLYRLTQLFGTPNVPGLEAGADQPDRELRTWQYLFHATYEPGADDPGEPGEWLLSVYDYKTSVSIGLSGFHRPEDEPATGIPQPGGELPPSVTDPGEQLLVGFVQLVLNVVEEPVRAAYEDLWV